MPGFDELEIEILPDGTIKVQTDKVSAANHVNAEAFLKFMAELAGGKSTRTRRGHHHHAHGEHTHTHEEEKH
jgi:hypothetical protein